MHIYENNFKKKTKLAMINALNIKNVCNYSDKYKEYWRKF